MRIQGTVVDPGERKAYPYGMHEERKRTGRLVMAALAAAIVVVSLIQPSALRGQGGVPTLSELGAGYVSPGGAVQLSFAGRLDAEAYVPGEDPAWLIPSTSSFATGRLRLFGDLFLGSRTYVTAELRADGGEAPAAGRAEVRLEQVFGRYTFSETLAVQAGKFASPVGSYPSRHHTRQDPLIRPPLMYEYRTMVSAGLLPGNTAGFVSWKDQPEVFRPRGAPPIWGAPYQWGAMAMGGAGRASWSVAALNSAPSSEPEEWEWDPDRMAVPSLVLTAGWRFGPWLRATLYHNRGPYLAQTVEGPVPVGADLNDYRQVLWGGEAVLERGHNTARIEAFHDRWEVPNVGEDPVDISYSLELVRTLAPGLYAAGRFGAIEFNEIGSGSSGYGSVGAGAAKWDYPVRRLQLGGGYMVLRNLELRAEHAWNWTQGPTDPDDDLFSAQIWVQF